MTNDEYDELHPNGDPLLKVHDDRIANISGELARGVIQACEDEDQEPIPDHFQIIGSVIQNLTQYLVDTVEPE